MIMINGIPISSLSFEEWGQLVYTWLKATIVILGYIVLYTWLKTTPQLGTTSASRHLCQHCIVIIIVIITFIIIFINIFIIVCQSFEVVTTSQKQDLRASQLTFKLYFLLRLITSERTSGDIGN